MDGLKWSSLSLVEQDSDWKETMPLPERGVCLVIHIQNAHAIFKPVLTSQLKWRNSGRWESVRALQTPKRPLTLICPYAESRCSNLTWIHQLGWAESIPWLFSQICSFSALLSLVVRWRILRFPGCLAFSLWMDLANGRLYVEAWRTRREKVKIPTPLLCFRWQPQWWLQYLCGSSSRKMFIPSMVSVLIRKAH